MGIAVETKDCTALSDAELSEMADICADGPASFDIGLLSKQREEWVLITLCRNGNALQGFSFSTLERIGGTPSVLIGLASVKRTTKRFDALRAMMGDQLRRAVLAFPDEDVIVGTRLIDSSGFEAFATFPIQEIIPRPGHRANGEERAWGRRLAKRFGIDGDYEDRSFVARGDGTPPCGLDYESLTADDVDADIRALFEPVNVGDGDSLIAFGWAMADDLVKLS